MRMGNILASLSTLLQHSLDFCSKQFRYQTLLKKSTLLKCYIFKPKPQVHSFCKTCFYCLERFEGALYLLLQANYRFYLLRNKVIFIEILRAIFIPFLHGVMAKDTYNFYDAVF